MKRSIIPFAFMTLAVMVLSIGITVADEGDRETRVISDRWSFAVGGYATDFRTDAAVGSGTVLGTIIRVEDQLGVESRPRTFRLDGLFRINEKQSLGFGYWGVNRDGVGVIDEQIEWDGNVFDVGARLESTFDTSYFRVDWRYSLLKTDRGEAGVALGISAYDFTLGIDGEAIVDDGEGGLIEEQVSASTSLVAPVPTVGAYLTYGILPRLLLRIEANLLDIGVGDIEGRLVDTSVKADWWFTDHFGAGAGINTTDIDYKDRGENPISVNYKQTGFLMYLTFAF